MTIRDGSATEQAILKEARAEIERTVYDSFSAECLEDDEEETPVSVSVKRLKTKDGSRAFRMTGKVISPRTFVESWHYDDDTRTGTIHFRVGSIADAKTLKAWAAENIGAIVENKIVVLEVGKAPPPGARYRLGEDRFEDGILSVDFEVLR